MTAKERAAYAALSFSFGRGVPGPAVRRARIQGPSPGTQAGEAPQQGSAEWKTRRS